MANDCRQEPSFFSSIIPRTRSRIRKEKKTKGYVEDGARWCDNTAALRHTTTMSEAHSVARSGCINFHWLPALSTHQRSHSTSNATTSHQCISRYNVHHAWSAIIQGTIETSKEFILRHEEGYCTTWFKIFDKVALNGTCSPAREFQVNVFIVGLRYLRDNWKKWKMRKKREDL